MRCIQSSTDAARARDSSRFCLGLPVASVCPAMTINQPGWALILTRAVISTLVEPGLSSALPVANSDRLSSRTGLGIFASTGAAGGC
ncbi:hypothetical protein D3C78_1772220 [compost metagenome]